MDSLLCCCKRCENSDAPIDTNLHATTLCCVSGNVQFDLKDGTSLDSSQETQTNTRSSFKKYYDFGKEGALNNTPETLLRLGRKRLPKLTRKQVLQFLTKQPSYTVHRRLAKIQFPRRAIQVRAPLLRVDADLIELGDLFHGMINTNIFSIVLMHLPSLFG